MITERLKHQLRNDTRIQRPAPECSLCRSMLLRNAVIPFADLHYPLTFEGITESFALLLQTC